MCSAASNGPSASPPPLIDRGINRLIPQPPWPNTPAGWGFFLIPKRRPANSIANPAWTSARALSQATSVRPFSSLSSRRLTGSWMALGRRPILPLGAPFIFFYSRKRADMAGFSRRLAGWVFGEALGSGQKEARTGMVRQPAGDDSQHGEEVRGSVRRTVLCSVSCLGEKRQRDANQRWKRPVDKGEWGMLPRTSMGQDRQPTKGRIKSTFASSPFETFV